MKSLFHLATAVPSRLNSSYVDANGDLVADLPIDVAKHLEPSVLRFSYLAGKDVGIANDRWQSLIDALENATGLKVELRQFNTVNQQLDALASGQLNVTAFNTGSVTTAVNIAGFVPVSALSAGDEPPVYTSKIIVQADSMIKSPADLKGRSLTFTSPTSNSGFRFPLLLMAKDFRLKPDIDYTCRFSQSHGQSIRDVVEGTADAAAVASDVLDLLVNSEQIDGERMRTIYESPRFPTACFGHAHNLAPELAAKVCQVLDGFAFQGTSLEEVFAPTGMTTLTGVNFEDDFSEVRLIESVVSPDRSLLIQ